MKVRKIEDIDIRDIKALESVFADIPAESVACCNWPDGYPYMPEVAFKMFHTGKALMLRYEVNENYTAALVTEDGGEVWTDSCVELFFSPDSESYYNLEATCIGKILLSNRKSRTEGIIPASSEILGQIMRTPSLGTEPFAERTGENHWNLILAIPPQALFRHDVQDWSGITMKMNIYKCGDNLSKPHFLSWKPIKTQSPDFHRPEYFTTVDFE